MGRQIDSSIVHHNARQRLINEDGRLYAHTIHYDDKAIERNNQIRSAGLIDKAKFTLHDNEDIRFVISCPDTLQWAIFKKKYPEIYKGIISKDEAIRMSSCKRLQILHPEWVIQERL